MNGLYWITRMLSVLSSHVSLCTRPASLTSLTSIRYAVYMRNIQHKSANCCSFHRPRKDDSLVRGIDCHKKWNAPSRDRHDHSGTTRVPLGYHSACTRSHINTCWTEYATHIDIAISTSKTLAIPK